ncbi:MAG: hypothetical protein AB7E61_00635 [Acholeplasmataceae bacterium]
MPAPVKKHSKLKWFHSNRIKILLYTVAIVIPTTLILLAYVGTYLAHSKVSFDDTNTEYIRSFENIDNLDLINLNFEWLTLRNLVMDEEGTITTNGYYQFRFSYDSASTYDVTSVVLTPVLQTNWLDYTHLGNALTLTEGTNFNMLLTYNYELPQRTLLFINVTDPILYLKVSINYSSAGQSLETVNYVKINLKDYNPNTVI